MMRDIKFRAWDKETKKYAEVGFHVIGEVTIFNGIHEYGAMFNPKNKGSLERYNDFVLEQFTGMKDKNGVEIYEGDICKVWDYGCGELHEQDYFAKITYGEEGGFNIDMAEYEVIGNIHENKELIK